MVWRGSPYHYDGHLHRRAIVIHTMAGYLAGSDSWFNSPNNPGSSSHYGVGLHGQAPSQYVRLEDSSWANGKVTAGSAWRQRYAFGDPNRHTYTIETEDSIQGQPIGTAPVTDQQYRDVRDIIADLILPYDREWNVNDHGYWLKPDLIGHYQIDSVTRANCPGARWTSGRMQQLADELGLRLWR